MAYFLKTPIDWTVAVWFKIESSKKIKGEDAVGNTADQKDQQGRK